MARLYGLRNEGNSCYLNAVAQAIARLPPLQNATKGSLRTEHCKKKKAECAECLLGELAANAGEKCGGDAAAK